MKLAVLERILGGLTLEPADFFRFLESLDEFPLPPRRLRAHDDSLVIAQAFEKLDPSTVCGQGSTTCVSSYCPRPTWLP
jgi:hypothetical protein